MRESSRRVSQECRRPSSADPRTCVTRIRRSSRKSPRGKVALRKEAQVIHLPLRVPAPLECAAIGIAPRQPQAGRRGF